MTVTGPEALEAMLAHHRALEEGVRSRVGAFVSPAGGGQEPARAAADLVAYLAGEVLPHAQAEEQTIYRSARTHEDLVKTLDQMIGEHETLAAATARLADSPDAIDAPVGAEQLAALFASHVARENDIVLPALVADQGVDLVAVLAEMHGLVEATRPVPGGQNEQAADATAAVVSLLVKAANALAKAGEGDEACRVVAAAWSALRGSRPELAVRVTATLHGLVRKVEPEPVSVTLASWPGGSKPGDTELDVRSFAPAQRHQLIFSTYDQLAPGTGFVLVNDHDPKPLGYQFEAEHAGRYTWDYLEDGPTVWRVRIGRPAADPVGEGARSLDGQELPELDVRALPHGGRHDSIFSAYERLVPGAGFVLVNDHDPKPLRYQFEAQFSGQYTWDYLEVGPTVWRVRIGRPAT